MISIPVVQLLLHWFVLSLAVWLTARIVPGFRLTGMWNAVVVAAIFGVVNFLLGTILYYFFGIITLGIGFLLSFLTKWFVNAILLKVTDALTSRLDIASFGTALIAALVMSVLGKIGVYAVDQLMQHPYPGSIYL
jgi:putative membrane protein